MPPGLLEPGKVRASMRTVCPIVNVVAIILVIAVFPPNYWTVSY